MHFDVHRVKPLVLPAAIILGILFHDFCEKLSVVVPYLIFSILFLTFSSTELRRLRFKKLDLWLMLFQIVAIVVLYVGFKLITDNETIAQGMMLAALCPVAASVTVVASMLGAKRNYTVAYTIIGNLLICVVAPLAFISIGDDSYMSLTDSFYAIFGKITTIIGLPFFAMLVLQLWAPPVVNVISRFSGLSFYCWALALFFTLGQTIDFIFIHGEGHWHVIIILGIGAAILCPGQFYIGRIIGRRNGDAVAGQQLLGQKNSAMGIWMSNTYLNPLASTFLAFYSIAQNLLNSWQIWREEQSQAQFHSDGNK